MLAPMAEEGWTENKVAKYAIEEYMKDFKEKNLDKLILGCTHYPLFKKLIKQEIDEDTEIINTGEEVSKYLKKYLEENNLQKIKKGNGSKKIYLTDTECNSINVAKRIMKEEIEFLPLTI